ncbi:efflux transporter outer membrane subunit [Defluviimonas salinarum]|uniref:Efflux transporter outer membrane subunit n=1 Tax=Defluviimonas salinarum TaxID=2992147 RepID=A0ABT3IXN3_9RHOB|nr:efflux transporter outer membrane subunit [Defluviimonas salinarum]MCW3780202.1 efflux transporter outer membrane subunit [Defluviimonas salinarum]
MAGKPLRDASCVASVAVASLLLTGCSVETPYQAPKFFFASTYTGHKDTAPVLLNNVAWWEGLKDPTLNSLVQRALAGSLSLAIATERVREAKADLAAVPTQVTANSDASVVRQKEVADTPETRADASLGLSWMLDPFGEQSLRKEASRARVEVADAEVDAARLLLLFNLANAYVDLRFNQRALVVRQKEVTSREETLELTESLLDKDAATKLDLVRAQARLAEARATVPGIRARIQGQKNQIATLLGTTPGRLDVNLDAGARQPMPRMSTGVGIPADLVRNRPDIRIAERLYYAAVAETGVARADLYPKLSLGGAISLARVGGNTGPEYFFGPAIALPTLPLQTGRARVAAQESRARQAHTNWTSTVINAIREVEDALSDYAQSRAATEQARNAVELYGEAVDLTRGMIALNGATLNELLDDEENLSDAEIALAANLRAQALAFVALNSSLGATVQGSGSPTVVASAGSE